jgi:hypothetical protein
VAFPEFLFSIYTVKQTPIQGNEMGGFDQLHKILYNADKVVPIYYSNNVKSISIKLTSMLFSMACVSLWIFPFLLLGLITEIDT